MANPRMTMTDIIWCLVYLLMFITLMVAALLGTLVPYLTGLGQKVTGPSEILEFALAMLSMLIAAFIALALFGLLTRRFLSPQSYARWMLQYQNGAMHTSVLGAAWQRLFVKMVRPRTDKEYRSS